MKADQQTTNEELGKFDFIFQKIIEFSKSSFNKSDKEVSDRFTECLSYNLISGKKLRGLFVVKCFEELNLKCTDAQLEKARMLGWCVELFQRLMSFLFLFFKFHFNSFD